MLKVTCVYFFNQTLSTLKSGPQIQSKIQTLIIRHDLVKAPNKKTNNHIVNVCSLFRSKCCSSSLGSNVYSLD